MSVGFFLGIKPSFLKESEPAADEFLREINAALRRERLQTYSEPAVLPDVYIDHRFGRSSLDHCSAGDIASLADFCPPGAACSHLERLATNPYRFSFLPLSFSHPIKTEYAEKIGGEETDIWIGSLQTVIAELQAVASQLDIPLSDGRLSDETARRIDDYQPFGDEDSCAPSDRIAWLMMYEGCRLALMYNVALSLAG